jgi:hypothetical protein
MRRILAAAVILVLAGPAGAATGLTSAPMIVPPGGVACTCLNLTAETIDVALSIGNGVPLFSSLGPGDDSGTVGHFPGAGTHQTTFCKVFRQGGGKLSAKQIACSISSVDADGNPTAVLPLDRKIEQ